MLPAGMEMHCCRQEWLPAGAPLPATNTWACRGAPPAPWTVHIRVSDVRAPRQHTHGIERELY